MKNHSIILLCATFIVLFIAAAFGQPTATWDTDGWTITESYTNPNPAAGSVVGKLEGTVTYQLGATPLPETTTQSVDLLAGPHTISQKFTSSTALANKYAISGVTGDGGAAFNTDGRLIITVTATNDAKPHSVSFKLKPLSTNWLARVPILRNLTAPRMETT